MFWHFFHCKKFMHWLGNKHCIFYRIYTNKFLRLWEYPALSFFYSSALSIRNLVFLFLFYLWIRHNVVVLKCHKFPMEKNRVFNRKMKHSPLHHLLFFVLGTHFLYLQKITIIACLFRAKTLAFHQKQIHFHFIIFHVYDLFKQ